VMCLDCHRSRCVRTQVDVCFSMSKLHWKHVCIPDCGGARAGIKVNSRAVLGEVMTALGVPASKFAAACVLVDKLEKVGGPLS
jgi:hypothetical protein